MLDCECGGLVRLTEDGFAVVTPCTCGPLPMPSEATVVDGPRVRRAAVVLSTVRVDWSLSAAELRVLPLSAVASLCGVDLEVTL